MAVVWLVPAGQRLTPSMGTGTFILADVPPPVWAGLAGLLFVATAFVQEMLRERRENRAIRERHVVAQKVEVADAKLDAVQKTGEQVHSLVNSAHGASLRALAAALRIIATDRPTPENITAADKAEKASEEHECNQAKVDAIAAGVNKR